MAQTEVKQAFWIWYPGDFEIRLHEKLSVKRKARDVMYPVYWRLDRHYSNVKFRTVYDLPNEETIHITAEGTFSFYLDGRDNYRSGEAEITLPSGKHEITVCVFNDSEIPALLIEGNHMVTDGDWEVTSYQNDWVKAASWTFSSPDDSPSRFRLSVTPAEPIAEERVQNDSLYDFGRETYGYLRFHGLRGSGAIRIYYGESRAEALSSEECYSLDRFNVSEAMSGNGEREYTLKEAKAFRYAWIQADPGVSWEKMSMLYEYVPLAYRGSFESSDDKLNEIYEMSLYTLHLNTREFFLDGIKRDQWVWSGDAYQSFLMNYYSFFDLDVTKRTLIALRGKDPLVKHINTILDYSLYWFVSLYDYYLYTGDWAFIRQYYDRAVTMMDFCLQQRNEEGFLEGRPKDWVFVDWADLNNEGAVSTIQILLVRSLEAMSEFAVRMGNEADSEHYATLATRMREQTIRCFWDEERGGLLHRRVDGVTLRELTKHANMFAMTYGYLTAAQREQVVHHVMLNTEVPNIRTPYMRFHELAVLCESGQHELVLNEIRNYWGGMIALGATTFWEEYDPTLEDDAHYSMYGVTFGKSLCHAWGAGPIYLFGKYFLGVIPTSPGYETYRIQPNLGKLERMKGTVPTGAGDIRMEMDNKVIRVESDCGSGVLILDSQDRPTCDNAEVRATSVNHRYEVTIEPGQAYWVKYRA